MSSSLSVYSVVLKCLFCSKLLFGTSENKQAIQQHMHSHGQSAEFIAKVKKWKCSLCHKAFKNEIKWKWHEQEHLGKPQFGSLHEEIEWTGSKAHRIVKCRTLDKNGRKKTNRFALNVESEIKRFGEDEEEEGESDMCWFGEDDKCYSCSKTRSELYNDDNIDHQFWMCSICYSGFCAKLKWRQHLNTTHILPPSRILYIKMLAKKNGSIIHYKHSSQKSYTKRML